MNKIKFKELNELLKREPPLSSARIQAEAAVKAYEEQRKYRWWRRGFYIFFFVFGVYIGLGLTT